MNQEALYNLSYGCYVLTAREGEKDNGCIINTAFQTACNPSKIGICLIKTCCTHGMIERTGLFNLSVLRRDSDFGLIKHFGFNSGLIADKFTDFPFCKRAANGVYYITEGTNAYISVKVNKAFDIDSHTLFIGEVTDMEVLSDGVSGVFRFSDEIDFDRASSINFRVFPRFI